MGGGEWGGGYEAAQKLRHLVFCKPHFFWLFLLRHRAGIFSWGVDCSVFLGQSIPVRRDRFKLFSFVCRKDFGNQDVSSGPTETQRPQNDSSLKPRFTQSHSSFSSVNLVVVREGGGAYMESCRMTYRGVTRVQGVP